MRLHAARGLEQLFSHVFAQLGRLAQDTQSADAPAVDGDSYDAHAVKRVLHKATALIRKADDVAAAQLGFRLVDASVRAAGPALLSQHPACGAIMTHLKQDVCLHLLTAMSR